MTPARCAEEARRIFSCPRCATVLPERAGLLWRTHDGGLAGFQAERLEEGLRRRLERLLGHGRQRATERAALPVRLLYGLAAGGLRLDHDPEQSGTLPGGGLLLREAETFICLSAEPLACLEALAEAEARGRHALLGRVLGSDESAGPHAPLPTRPEAEHHAAGSCGRCGGLLGGEGCMGGCCVNHEAQ
jgi:hypothetical protein